VVEDDLSDMTSAVSYLDGSQMWETLAGAYESGADQQLPRPLPSHLEPLREGHRDQRGEEGAVIARLPSGGGYTNIHCLPGS